MIIPKVHKSEKNYPRLLLNSKNAPEVLYYLGNISIVDNCIAVIGKRNVSDRILQISYLAGKKLASKGYTLLNGMAIGCDISSIKGALSESGKVVAVLPCGLDNIYPKCNKEIADEILSKGGCLISEYPPGIKPEKYRFIERDRIQAAVSSRIFVLYSDIDGGTMHTMKFAKSENKPIGCYIDQNEVSKGNELFINKYGAISIKDTDELIHFVTSEPIFQMSIFEDVLT